MRVEKVVRLTDKNVAILSHREMMKPARGGEVGWSSVRWARMVTWATERPASPMLLEWSVPAECPSKHDVVEQVTALAGEAAAALPVRVWARVVRVKEGEGEGSRWRLELRIGSERAEPRVLESDGCRKLAEATAFIVALDLHARAEHAEQQEQHEQQEQQERDEVAKAPPPARSEAAVPLAPPPRVPPGEIVAASPPARVRAHGGLGGDLVSDHGTLPTLAWAGGIYAYATYGSFRGELGAALWPRTRAIAASLRGAGASVTLRTASLRGCWTPTSVVPWIDGCLRVEAGVLHTAGYGITRPAVSDGLWLAGLAGLTARPDVAGPVGLRFTAELGVPLRYAPVTIEGIGEVYSPAPVVFRFAVGLESKLF